MKKVLRTITLSTIAGLTFAGTIALASWTAHWWGTDWIQDHETISAQKIAENFEYLKQRIDEISSTSTSSVDSGIGGMVVFDTPGTHTWTVPDGVRKVKVNIVGGGGGAGGYHTEPAPRMTQTNGGNGGGGAWRFGVFDVTPGEELECVVGAGGIGAHGVPDRYGTNGGDSIFATMVAGGGNGGRSRGNAGLPGVGRGGLGGTNGNGINSGGGFSTIFANYTGVGGVPDNASGYGYGGIGMLAWGGDGAPGVCIIEW